jgi:hypothetical protein
VPVGFIPEGVQRESHFIIQVIGDQVYNVLLARGRRQVNRAVNCSRQNGTVIIIDVLSE